MEVVIADEIDSIDRLAVESPMSPTSPTIGEPPDIGETTRLIGINNPDVIESEEAKNDDVTIKKSCWKVIFSTFLVVFLTIAYLVSNVGTNVGMLFMGYYMPIYPAFLNYWPSLLTGILFLGVSISLRERWRLGCWEIVILFVLGIANSANYIFTQIAIPRVDPEITPIIIQSAQVQTWILALFVFRENLYVIQLVAYILISVGLFIGTFLSYIFHTSGSHSTFSDSPLWIFFLILSAPPLAVTTVFQDYAFSNLQMPKFLTMSVYFFMTVLSCFFVQTISTGITPFGMCPGEETQCFNGTVALTTYSCEFSDMKVLTHQWNAFKCFIGCGSVWGENDPCCGSGMKATIWLIVYVVSCSTWCAVEAFLLELRGSVYIANLNALSYPIGCLVLWIPFIADMFVSDPKWWIVVAFCIIFLGNVCYSNQEFVQKYCFDIRIQCPCVIHPKKERKCRCFMKIVGKKELKERREEEEEEKKKRKEREKEKKRRKKKNEESLVEHVIIEDITVIESIENEYNEINEL